MSWAPIRAVLRWVVLKLLRASVSYGPDSRKVLPRTPSIVVANHVSLIDGLLIALASPTPLTFAVDSAYSRANRLTRTGMSLLSRVGFGAVVPVDPTAPFGMRALASELRSGRSVMIFPEGAISPDGRPTEPKPGLAWLSRRCSAPILEVRIEGAERSRLFAKAGTKLWPAVHVCFP